MNTENKTTKDFKGIEDLSDIFGLSVSETIEKLHLMKIQMNLMKLKN